MQTPFSPYAPLRNALSRSLEADESRKREGDAQEAVTIKDSLNKIAAETQIPANILFAIAETSGADTPERVISAARNAGNRLSGAVRDGKSYEDALSEAIGDDKIAGGMLMRAKQLADQFDPLGPLEDQSRPETANALRDLPAAAVSAAVEGLGAGAPSMLEAAEGAMQPHKMLARVARTAGIAPEGSTAGKVADIVDPDRGANARAAGEVLGAPIKTAGRAIDEYLVSQPQAQAMRDTQITGSIFDPASLDVSDEASVRGWLGHGAAVVGSMLPMLITKSPAAAAGIGAVMGAGDAGTDAGAFVDQMAAEVTQGGTSTKLYDESAVYRGMVDAGVPHAEALERTKQQAQRVAETGAAAVAGLGGAATNKLIRGAEDFVGGMASRAARAGGTAALSGLEEGAQEVAEGMIGRAGAGLGAGVDRQDITEGTGQEFIMGAMGGAVPGAVAGALSQGPQARGLDDELPPAVSVDGTNPPSAPPGLPGPAQMLGLPAPEAGPLAISGPSERRVEPPQSTSSAAYAADPAQMRDVSAQGTAPMGIEPQQSTSSAAYGVDPSAMRPAQARPAGSLTAARELIPGPVLKDAKPGDTMMMTLQERPDAPVPVKIVGEDAIGVKAVDQDTGEDMHIPRAEIERGAVRLALPPPAAMPEEAKGVQDQYAATAQGQLPAPPERLALAGPAAGMGQPAPATQPDQPPVLGGVRNDGDTLGASAGAGGRDTGRGSKPLDALVGIPAAGAGGQGGAADGGAATVQPGGVGDGVGVSDAVAAGDDQPALTFAPDQKGAKEMMQRDYPPPAAYGKGEVLVTASGRATTPFPELKFGTPARSRNNVKRVNDWFMAEALAEARARGDDFAAGSFEQDQGKGDKTPQASLEMAAIYLDMQRQPVGAQAGDAKSGKSSRTGTPKAGVKTGTAEQNSTMASAPENDVPKAAKKTPMTKDQLYKQQPKAEQDATEEWWLEQIPAKRAATLVAIGWKGDDDMIDALSRSERWDELGPTIRNALTNIRLALTEDKAEDAPKAEEKPEPKADTAPTGRKPLSEAVPGSVKHGKTGPETGVMLADQAYAFIKSHMADGEPRTAGMSLSHDFGDGVRGPMSFAFDEDNSYKDRYAKPKGKVFVRGPNGLHSFWFTVADIDAEIERAKPAQGKSELPGGVAEGEERAEDQGEANPAPAKPAVTLPSALEADIRRIVGSKTAQSQQHYVGRYDVIVTDRGVMVYRGGEEVAGLGKITKNPDEAIEAMRSLVALDAPAPAKQPPAQVDDAGEKVGTMPGTVPTNDAAALDMAEVGKKWNKLRGPSKKMMLGLAGFEGEAADALREKSWADIDADTQAKLADAMEGKKTGEKLADFGAEISDSRKMRAKSMMEAMFAGQMPVAGEFVGKPLATVWPDPDYAALVASGVDPRKVAALAMLRNYDADKPRRQYRLRVWADNMVKRMDAAKQVADGADHAPFFKKLLGEGADAALEIIEGGDVARMGDLSRINVLTKVSRRDFDVPRDHPNAYTTDNLSIVMPWMKARGGIGLTFGTSEPVEAMRAGILRLWDQRRERMAASRGESGDKKVVLSTASKPVGRGVNVYVIVADFGRGPVEIYGEFADQDEAKAYLSENKADLEDSAREMRLMRNEEWLRDPPARKSPVEWRTGDVSIKLFADTFGIDLEGQGGAGVQFGQSTLSSNKEAQERLNQVYDAFMDMAAVLGLPPKAMFLNGKLRLALGARGKGGRNPAAAHHETDRGIINLTRASGAGTLSHEWFHAIDNLIVREAEAAAAADPKVSKWNTYDRRTSKTDVNNRYATATDIEYRPLPAKLERAQKAADALRRALRKNSGTDGWITRADRLDKLRGDKPYFNTTIELAARAFERVVFDRLAERGLTNGFLVGIDTESGAYPTPRELQRDGVAAAMGELIEAARDLLADEAAADTIETKSLPEIDLTYGYVGPKVGMSWEGEDGKTRRILSSKPDSVMGELFTVDLGNGREEVMRSDAIERLIDTDEAATDPEALARKGVRDTAKQKKDDAQAAREALLNMLKEDARQIITENATGPDREALLSELKYGDARAYLSGQNVQEAVPLALSMFRDGYRVQESRARVRSKVRNVLGIRDKEGFGWNEVGNDGKRILPPAFIRMMQLLADVEARKKRAEDPNPPKEMTEDELDQLFGKRPAPEPEPEPEAPQPEPAPAPQPTPEPEQDRADDMGLLSKAEKDRLAALRDKFRSKISTQLNSGLDPELVAVAAEMAAIYIKAGARRFRDLVRAMVEDLELPFATIQPYARSAYNQVRGDKELADEDVTGMDDDKAVIAEIRAMIAEEKAKEDAKAATEEGQNDEPAGNRGGDPERDEESQSRSGEGAEADGAALGGEGPRADGGSRNLDAGKDGDEPVGGVERGGEPVPQAVKAEPIKGENPGNYVLTETDSIGTGTDGEKIKANIAAIRAIKEIEAENRYATREEQAALAKYVGWGGLKTVFDPRKTGATDQYGRAQAELKELLTKEEYEAAFDSVKNAHYTAPGVVKAMWQAMAHFGFTGGRALEPTVGVGNFIGFQPEGLMADTEWHGAELDSITGRIAKHLYPDAKIMAATGFENAPFARGVFDIAIGNPPFGQEPISRGREKDLLGLKIHNYIIAKTGRHLRPGGIMAMVVTHRFLDTANDEARSRLAQDFRFMGAIRLPNDAFLANAGTEVVTDIVFFQKLKDGDQPDMSAAWLDTNGKLDGDIRVNRYFAENPGNILGRSAMDGTMYAHGGNKGEEYTVHGDGRDLAEALESTIKTAFAADKGALGSRSDALEAAVAVESISTLPLGGMMLDDKGQVILREEDGPNGEHRVSVVGEDSLWKQEAAEWSAIYQRIGKIKASMDDAAAMNENWDALVDETAFLYVGGVLRNRAAKPTKAVAAIYDMMDDGIPRVWGKKQREGLAAAKDATESRMLNKTGYENVKAQLQMRQDMLKLIRAERADADDAQLKTMRKALGKLYDAYVKKFGFINASENRRVMRGDNGVEMGLEAKYTAKNDDGPESAEKASILEKRVYFPHRGIDTAETPADGLIASIIERGRVDIPFIAKITGLTPQEVIEDLTGGDEPRIFLNPETNGYEDAETYLSGNVKAKLKVARDEGLPEHVKALEAVQPAPLPRERIVPAPRSLWIPTEVFEEFMGEIGVANAKVSIYLEAGSVSASGMVMASMPDYGRSFQHDRADSLDMFRSMITGKPMKIYDGRGEDRVLNEGATREVNAIIERVGREFEKWAYQNSERAQKIVDAYNQKMNTHVERKFDGVKYLRTVGMSPSIRLRNSQKNGAWRMMTTESSLMHHIVGAGKTFTAIVAVMERKRMGLSKKPLIVVPNHLVEQWASEFRQAYPGARLLAATKDDFEKKNRRRLLSRIATGDYDAIIIGHSSMKFIENSDEDLQRIITEQVDMLQEVLEEARRVKDGGGDKRTLTQIRNSIKKYRDRLKTIADKAASRTDELGLTFRDMGIDYLVVDEAHEFKNLEYQTGGERLVGMNSPQGSQKAFDLYVKTRTLLDANDRGPARSGVGFLTGTPISNSLVEAYSMMKYLIPRAMKQRGVAHFDSWAASYVQAETRFEYNATQKLVERRVMSRLVNLSSLSQLYREFADVIMAERLHEIYAEQVRDENERDGTNKSEKFPVPKVKGGGRQLDSAPASKEQREYTEYLASRMIGMKGAPDKKKYARIDNALWVLSDARKASIDIRTVDPEQGRHPDSKVSRAAARIFAKWQATEKVRGTQLVFSDLSTPKKAARSASVRFLTDALSKTGIDKKTAKARAEGWADAKENLSHRWAQVIERINSIIDNPETKDDVREDLIEWMDDGNLAEAAGSMLTFDTGFSVYDDLKAALVEKGIPAAQIAFIHDFDTDKGKAKLFADVNSGKVRVLIGSTPKMGAGTNVQKRLVAEHHMDSPWRPSDVEQREGRIIRSGNELYEADPEGFEVDIWAYSTEGTSDVVLWQVLERKARSIEQFLNGALDSMEEEGGDSDDYAQFMAQSTGNPVFLRKLETERALLMAESEVAGLLMAQADAKSFLRNYDSRIGASEAMLAFTKKDRLKTAMIDGESVAADPADLAPALAAYREKYMAAEQAHEDEVEKIREQNAALKAEGKRQLAVPKFEMDAPGIMAAEVQAASSYARLIRKALLKVKDMRPQYGSGTQNVSLVVRFDGSNDVNLTVTKAPTAIDPRKNDYTVTLRYGDESVTRYRGGRQLTMSMSSSRVIDPTSSPSLWSGFYPAAIQGEIDESGRNADSVIRRMKEERPEMERRAALDIDTAKVAETKSLLEFYKADVAIAEAEREKEVSEKPQNRYEILDIVDGRLFGRESGTLINEKLFFEVKEGGEFDGTYVGTGIGAGTASITVEGKEPRRGFFEAVNEKTGRRAIFEAMHSEYSMADKVTLDGDISVDAEGWGAIRMMVDPAVGGDGKKAKADATVLTRERRAERNVREDGSEAGQKGPTSEQLSDMRETLEREMKRMKIPARVSLRVMKFLTDGLGNPVQGMFHWAGQDAGKIDISMSEHGGDKRKALATLRHELIHALRSPEIWGGEFGLFTKDEWSALVRAARADIGIRDWVRKNYAELDAAWQTEEMVAEYVSKWAAKQDEARSGILSAALAKARDMILAMVRAVVPWAAPRVSGAEVARAIMAGQIGARGPSGPGGGFFVTPRLRKEVKDMLAAGHISGEDADRVLNARYRKVSLPGGGEMEISAGAGVRLVDGLPQRAKDLARHALTQAMSGNYNLMALVPGRALFEELGKNLISARSYLSIKDKMDTVRNEWHGTTDKVSKHWRKLIAEDSEANSKLMDIMHESTIWQVDPTKEFKRLATVDQLKIVQERGEDINAAQGPVESAAIRAFLRDRERRVKHASLRVQLNALPANFQSMYSEVRDHYVTMQEAYDAALKENIEKAAKITIRRAERKLQAVLDEIDSDGDLTDAEKDAARDKAIALRDKTVSQAKQGAAARSVGLRKLFESNRIDGPYFPLARFGQFFVTVKDKSGNIVSFSRFETALMQEKAAEAERKAGNTVEIGVLAEKDGSRGAVDPRFVAEVEAMLAGADVPFEVMDAIWQKWLDTLPEVSVRRNRIHRKGTEGFTPDALRAFASNMFHSAHQLARLQYGMDLQDALDEAELEARRAADPNRAMLVVNEMGKRHAFIMNPKGASWAQFASSAAFIWYLAVTPAAALVNLTQTTVIGIPMLATLHKGEGSGIVAAADEIQKAGRQFVAGRFKIENHPDLTDAERAAMKEAYDRGVIDKSQAHDLAGVAETGVEYKPRVNMVMEKVAFLFHHTERANREVTFLAAYRMARKGGMDHEAAITAAAQATWKTHFDYQNTSRPRFMQGDAAKVLFTFRNYQVNMIWRLFRDVHQAFKGEDEATRKEARRQLFGITGMMMLHAGVSGTWLFGITMMIAGLFFGGGADEAEAEFKDAIVDLLGPTVGGAIWYGPAGQMTGIDLTSRIGMPDLWFRSSDRDLEGEDAYNYWLQQTVGPVPGILEGFFRGAQIAGDGNWYRGIETAAPKAIRDAMKSARYATDGVETMKGDPLLDTVGALDVLKQFSGFTPAQVAQQYELNSLLKNREARIIDRRQKLMARAAKAIMDGEALPDSVTEGINAFNAEFPEYPITPKTLKRSIKARIAAAERVEGGIMLNARLNDRLRGEVE